MKFTVNGFNQRTLLNLDLDAIDATVLRWFVDFQGTGRMEEKHSETGVRFYWVRYQWLISDLPILGLKTADSVMRRFQKLARSGVLEHHHCKRGGSFSTYRLGGGYLALLDDTPPDEKSEGGPDEKSDPLRMKSRSKDPSTKRSIYITAETGKDAENQTLATQVLAYLNKTTGASFRSHKGTGLQALVDQGVPFADFVLVIDAKAAEWLGGEFAKYLRPSTLFRPAKFDEYLNAVRLSSKPALSPSDLDRSVDPLAHLWGAR